MNAVLISYCFQLTINQEQSLLVTKMVRKPVPVAARSKARSVLNSSNIEVVVSNPARGTDVYLLFLCVVLSCEGIGLAMCRSPVQGSPTKMSK